MAGFFNNVLHTHTPLLHMYVQELLSIRFWKVTFQRGVIIYQGESLFTGKKWLGESLFTGK